MQSHDIENESLASHVALCAMRYKDLDGRLSKLEQKLNKVSDDLSESKNSLAKVIITSTGLIISSVIGAIVTILIKF